MLQTLTARAVLLGSVLAFGGMAAAQTQIKIDGSSTVFPISQGIAEEFGTINKNVHVTVGESGTSAGFKKFLRKETDISDASRPITAKEMEEAKAAGIEYIELPIAFDALTVVVNKSNTFLTQLTIEDLHKIWGPESKVKTWDEVRPEWPKQPITLFGAGSASGTFDYFTEAVNGKSKASRTDYTPSEDDNVLVQGVAKDKNAMGYFGYAYYAANTDTLKAVPIVNKAGKATLPSVESVKDGSYNPFARPIFIYVNKASLARPEVKQFVEFYLTKASDIATEVKYVALPSEAYQKCLQRLNKQETGTAFGGHNEAGVAIGDLLNRPLVHEPTVKPEAKPEGTPKKK
jgi:phosphate transport system substrate-binding protein